MQINKVVLLVSPMGHDVIRIADIVSRWLCDTGRFTVSIAGIHPKAECSIKEYMTDEKKVAETALFFFLCADDYWDAENEKRLVEAVSGGKGVLFFHGVHPCFRNNPEIEKMIGLLWRETATHGDFNTCPVNMTKEKHPITDGVSDFETWDELFCLLENPWNVPIKVLATAHSDKERESRWGHHGTGLDEPILTIGEYGKGKCVNFLLGHVWTHYTGHGLMENTTISMEPPQFKVLLLRSCEWAAYGEVTIK
ncbi:MAG: ThuA domain-containing protein [Acetatifactor sp.]|nr:ThuA domain-containing protein [Acetatifactor sp.]